jgi:hypothetical protein
MLEPSDTISRGQAMNSLKIVLSAFALAALVTAPAAAQSRTPSQPQVPAYSSNSGYGQGHVLGTDPDPRIRSEIVRDGNSYYNSNN